MSKPNTISDAEWVLMQVLWAKSPLSAQEVYDAISRTVDWHPKTVRTLLGRLVTKKALQREKVHGTFRFSPIVSEAACVRVEGDSFLQRCFSGKAMPMLAHFIENESLAPEEIAALRLMLDRKLAEEHDHE